MTLASCVSNVAKELGLDEADVKEIADRLQREKKRLAADPTVDRVDEQLRQFATEEAEKARIAAALRRKQAALNIILRDEWERDVGDMVAQGVSHEEAVMAKLVGSYQGVTKSRKSVSARRNALESAWLGGMLQDIKADPELEPVLRVLKNPRAAKPLMDDVVREMRELHPDGKPGLTGNASARKLADIMAKYAEASRLELNKAGANIGKLDGWSPQAHDGVKMLRVRPEEWADSIMGRLDLDRSFPNRSSADAKAALVETYLDITTGRDRDITAAQMGQRVGPANLARSLEANRVLHFKDADSWLAYNEQFGRGNIITAMIDHLHGAARKASLMQVMGPNPRVFLDGFLADTTAALRKGSAADPANTAKEIGRLTSNGSSKIGKAMAELTGETSSPLPGGVTAAKINGGIRSVITLARLGGTFLSSFNDLVTYAHQMRVQTGQGVFDGYAKAFQALFDGRPRREQQQLALMFGVAHDSILGDIHARFQAEDNLPGWLSKGMNAFFRLQGLQWWTDKLTNAFARMTSAFMADHANMEWRTLPDQYRGTLERYGFDERRWDVARRLVGPADDGTRYVFPEMAREIDEADLAGLLPEGELSDAARARHTDRIRRDLELDLRAFMADQAHTGILEPDDRTRVFTKQGTRPGTLTGEAMRFIMQFKSFPVAYMQKILIPAIQGQRGQRDYAGIASLIAMSTVFGYASMTAKDMVKNKTPRDPTKPATIAAAFVQGGGLGIMGDFLFSKANRFGNGPLETVAGPGVGTAADLIQIWQQMTHGDGKASNAFWTALNNTPYLNLWWLRQGLDLAVLNDLQETMSPGTFRRREADMKKEFGQSYLLDPLAPTGR